MIKTSKGFTLIELLAVIVILAVIALIATPIVFNTVETAKTGSIKSSAYGYLNAIEYYVATTYSDENTTNDIPITGTFDYALNKANIKVKGTQPTNVAVTLANGKVVSGSLTYDNYLVMISDGEVLEVSKGQDVLYTKTAKVYGVVFNGSAGTRTDSAVGLAYTVNASTITSAFDTAEIYNEITEVTDTYGNVFVKIPRFYISKSKTGSNFTYKISKTKQDATYYLPYSFYDEATNAALPYVLIGKYNASLNGTKLESKSGTEPLVSQTIATFRTYAKNNNVGLVQGYQLLDIHAIDVIQTLFYVEFATLNSQSIMQGYTTGQYSGAHTITSINGTNLTMGVGIGSAYKIGQTIDIGTSVGGRQIAKNLRITNIVGDIITYELVAGISTIPGTITIGNSVYNVGYLSGTTDLVTTTSGSPTSNTDGKYAMKYRGIENMYGNVYQFIDGINIQNNQTYIATNPSSYVSDTFTGAYKAIGYVNKNTNGYVTEMGYDSANPAIQLPTVTGTNTYGDYYYQATGNNIALFGGSWDNGGSAGLSRWFLSASSGGASVSIGSRSLKKAL